MTTLGKRIHTLRTGLGMDQNELAKKAGISQSIVSLYEHDRVKKPSAKHLLAIAAVLGTTPQYLLYSAGPKALADVVATAQELMAVYNSLSPETQASLLVIAKTLKDLP